mmetsp:Transcript_79424/g.233389  ORF Transcript_79424/g.233389 Transcript_79424/m.233389 type:complete len:257 (+) Transcript_79424:1380-2150(+)
MTCSRSSVLSSLAGAISASAAAAFLAWTSGCETAAVLVPGRPSGATSLPRLRARSAIFMSTEVGAFLTIPPSGLPSSPASATASVCTERSYLWACSGSTAMAATENSCWNFSVRSPARLDRRSPAALAASSRRGPSGEGAALAPWLLAAAPGMLSLPRISATRQSTLRPRSEPRWFSALPPLRCCSRRSALALFSSSTCLRFSEMSLIFSSLSLRRASRSASIGPSSPFHPPSLAGLTSGRAVAGGGGSGAGQAAA